MMFAAIVTTDGWKAVLELLYFSDNPFLNLLIILSDDFKVSYGTVLMNYLKMSECTLSVRWVCVECTLSVHWVCVECALSVHWVYVECTLSVRWVCVECTLSVCWVYVGVWRFVRGWTLSATRTSVRKISATRWTRLTHCRKSAWISRHSCW